MSGSCAGVQTRLKEVAPYATYIHCYAHSLNLVLVDCAKAIPHAAEFFCLMGSLYVFIAATKAHAIFRGLSSGAISYPTSYMNVKVLKIC